MPLKMDKLRAWVNKKQASPPGSFSELPAASLDNHNIEDPADAAYRLSHAKQDFEAKLDFIKKLISNTQKEYARYKHSVNPILRYVKIKAMVDVVLKAKQESIPGIPCPGRQSAEHFWKTTDLYLKRYPLSKDGNASANHPVQTKNKPTGLVGEAAAFADVAQEYREVEREKSDLRDKFSDMSDGDINHQLLTMKEDIKAMASTYCSIRRELGQLEEQYRDLGNQLFWQKYSKLKTIAKQFIRSSSCTQLMQE